MTGTSIVQHKDSATLMEIQTHGRTPTLKASVPSRERKSLNPHSETKCDLGDEVIGLLALITTSAQTEIYMMQWTEDLGLSGIRNSIP